MFPVALFDNIRMVLCVRRQGDILPTDAVVPGSDLLCCLFDLAEKVVDLYI